MTEADQLKWKWSSNGCYTSASAYKALISAGKLQFPLHFIWKIKVPPSIKIFIVCLPIYGRLLTQDQLLRRNIPCTQNCVLCQQHVCETASHLFFYCSFAARLWNDLGMSVVTALEEGLQHTLLHLFQSYTKKCRL
ncbi:hypothetical protein LUZ62_026032 [Rhynchospora pubera]|uniref:Reverse transcriptase zinc-binding domain-containing protein n=1 Tax=Rhynchospora pubera TaxID=906938 RepID=A0AAV8HCP9_9POAL|nr:hypothetical protein LUZ62_026032 [Rhynchospora pubera]